MEKNFAVLLMSRIRLKKADAMKRVYEEYYNPIHG